MIVLKLSILVILLKISYFAQNFRFSTIAQKRAKLIALHAEKMRKSLQKKNRQILRQKFCENPNCVLYEKT